MKQRRIDNSRGIFLMWLNWVISTGTLVLTVLLSLWVSRIYVPFIAFAFEIILFTLIRRNREARVPACYLMPFICSRILFWSAVVMVLINLINTNFLIQIFPSVDIPQRNIPFIPLLIFAPIALIVSLWGNVKKKDLSFCRDCKMRYGTPAERGFLGLLFTQEGRYQNRLLFVLSATCTLVSYTYYIISHYQTVPESLDNLFYIWMPVGFYVATILYSASRYIGLWGYYCRKEENIARQEITMTKLRYLLFWDNYIAVMKPVDEINPAYEGESKPDTPLQVNLSYRQNMTLFDATRHLETIAHMKGIETRLMYETLNTNADYNIFHYICFLNDDQKKEFDRIFPEVKWITLREIAQMINRSELAPLLSAEFIRLYTIAMAYKTYYPNGKRKYAIKHYCPTFRIRDIKDIDVDYNDMNWLYVADNNEDVPFYSLRRFWRKYINGIG